MPHQPVLLSLAEQEAFDEAFEKYWRWVFLHPNDPEPTILLYDHHARYVREMEIGRALALGSECDQFVRNLTWRGPSDTQPRSVTYKEVANALTSRIDARVGM
jgi:hypothetical protein